MKITKEQVGATAACIIVPVAGGAAGYYLGKHFKAKGVKLGVYTVAGAVILSGIGFVAAVLIALRKMQ